MLLLASFVDEIATATTGQVQSSMITEYIVNLREIDYNEGVSIFSGLSALYRRHIYLLTHKFALADINDAMEMNISMQGLKIVVMGE